MIKNIKFGIKIATINLDFLPDIYENNKIIDYIEVIIPPEFKPEDIDVIKSLKMPYAVHLPNSNNGIDLGDIDKNEKNLEFIDKVNSYKEKFDELNSICYIIHPESGDVNLSIENLKRFRINPIAIENMPFKGISSGELIGYSPDTLKIYFERINDLEFCFDINHAIKAAISMKKDYIKFIEEFLAFKKPRIFHISGGNLNIEIDEHLSLAEGQYNIALIKKVLLNYGTIVNLTFETHRNYENKIKDDLKNMDLFIKS